MRVDLELVMVIFFFLKKARGVLKIKYLFVFYLIELEY